ncbi:caspase family protein [bacterium]|nr:caspase family protein [bacterium]
MKYWLTFILFIISFSAHAAIKKFAIIAGNNTGGYGKAALQYAEKDATSVYQVLTSLGDFNQNNVVFLRNQDAIALNDSFSVLSKNIKKSTESGDEVVFFFYYSGHADNNTLRLGDSVFPSDKLKNLIKTVPAQVKIAVIDSCHSGSFTQTKGGTKAAPFEVVVDDQLKVSGDVFITSSTELETSQESDELSGSYFTHYFTAGLKGAADSDHDNRISLYEAYQYAYTHTVRHSAEAIGPIQHPTFLYELKGKGDIILADLTSKSSYLLFPPPLKGTFYIYDRNSQWMVGEFDKESAQNMKFAVSPGRFSIKQKDGTLFYEKDFDVIDGQSLTISMTDAIKKPLTQGAFKRTLQYSYASSAKAGEKVILQKGTIIKVRLLENLSSKTSYIGEKIHMEAATDVQINNKVVIRENAQAIGEILDVGKGLKIPPFPNRKGMLIISIRFVEAVDGTMVPLSSMYAKKGKGGRLQNAKYIRGTEFDAFVDETTTLNIP